jgi:hypothetical protein
MMNDRTCSSRHVERETTVMLDGPPGRVFPLFGPIREADWAEGWSPTLHYRGRVPGSEEKTSGEDDAIGTGAVFTHPKGKADSHWLLTTWDEPGGRVEYAVVVPDTWVCRISIRVTAAPDDRSSAMVRYEYTGLDADGLDLVEGYTQEKHDERIAGWARAIDYYLETGTRLRAPHD